MEGSSINRQEVLGMEVFNCAVCSKPLRPEVYECPNGKFICFSCRCNLPESERAATQRSSGMQYVVTNLPVPCKHGCATKIRYYQKEGHERCCPLGPCACPVSGCGGFVAQTAAALFDHLTTLHELPAVDIDYFVPFEHRVQPAGTCVVLRGKYGRLFVLDVAPAAPGSLDLAVSLTCVQPSLLGVSLCFSCLDGHYETSRWNMLPDGAQTQRLCVVPKVSGGGETVVVLSITIDLVCQEGEDDLTLEGEDDDDEDYDYETETEEEDA